MTLNSYTYLFAYKVCRNSNLASSAYNFPQSQLSSGSFIFAYCLSALVAAGVKNVKGGLGGMIELFGPDGLYYLVQMKYIQITK